MQKLLLPSSSHLLHLFLSFRFSSFCLLVPLSQHATLTTKYHLQASGTQSNKADGTTMKIETQARKTLPNLQVIQLHRMRIKKFAWMQWTIRKGYSFCKHMNDYLTLQLLIKRKTKQFLFDNLKAIPFTLTHL